jgi:UDP-N-acetylglucosamine 2-epimerase (non-hydrolysing)
MSSPRIMTIYGTRPEAIKVAPVIKAIEAADDLESLTLVTGQHREMLDQVNKLFGIEPDWDLNIMSERQTLNKIIEKVIKGLDSVFAEARPDGIVVQGDTTTVLAAAIAAFNVQIPVVHLEAGLRSGDLYNPFPEEANRRLTSQIAALHLAPTATSRDNLLRENIADENIVVTGNTVIDALLHTVDQDITFGDAELERETTNGDRVLLVTAHRRENHQHMGEIGQALSRLAERYPELRIVVPAHRNPRVREALLPPIRDKGNVTVIEPLDYGEFTTLMNRSHLILTDSGGVQEEAPSLGKPVLVMRDNTERPEAVEAGTVKLIGTDQDRIVDAVSEMIDVPALYNEMAKAMNPYGDGQAAQRCVGAIRELF